MLSQLWICYDLSFHDFLSCIFMVTWETLYYKFNRLLLSRHEMGVAMKHAVQLDDKYVSAFGNHMKSNLKHLLHARDSF